MSNPYEQKSIAFILSPTNQNFPNIKKSKQLYTHRYPKLKYTPHICVLRCINLVLFSKEWKKVNVLLNKPEKIVMPTLK